jgi:pyruvate,orthophosphate dikinase
MFGTVVMNIPSNDFEHVLFAAKDAAGVKDDSDLSIEHLKSVVQEFKNVYKKHGKEFLEDPYAQLYAAVLAVFNSWKSDRAIKYREAEGITGLLGTAVNVQAMVFGNMGPTSGTGVCFSRNPNNGEKVLYGEYLINAQGEDVVAGIRTPQPISTLKEALPKAYDELVINVNMLEKHFHDMQDIEFTIQEGRLFMLQTRSGKRVGPAAVKIAVDMVDEGLATGNQAIMMVKPEHLNQPLHPQFQSTTSKDYKQNVLAKGLPASPGAAVGKIVFSPEEAEALHAKGEKCILVRDETSPEDVGGMWASQGVLTARGGMTSHGKSLEFHTSFYLK